MNTTLKALSVFAVTLVASLANASEWELDSSHTTAQFTVRHMMVTNVRGQFQKVSGTVSLDDKPDPELIDMRRRFWIALVLTVPVFVIEMGGHLFGQHLVSPAVSNLPNVHFMPFCPVAILRTASSKPLSASSLVRQ